jgi:hypothetical protein
MGRLGKPKGSRNKKTIERLAATAATQDAHSDNLGAYSASNDEMQLLAHPESFDNLRGPEPHALPEQMDTDFMGFSGTLDVVSPSEWSLNMHPSQRVVFNQPTEKFLWGLSGEIDPNT